MTVTALDRTLAALADPARRRAVELLRERARPAGELAADVGVSPATMSKHLRALKAAQIVEEANPAFDARVRIYALRRQPIAELRLWLDSLEALWSQQLAAFKAHLESGADD
jgi:DNA-binding transcriptional ArsR family regulator